MALFPAIGFDEESHDSPQVRTEVAMPQATITIESPANRIRRVNQDRRPRVPTEAPGTIRCESGNNPGEGSRPCTAPET